MLAPAGDHVLPVCPPDVSIEGSGKCSPGNLAVALTTGDCWKKSSPAQQSGPISANPNSLHRIASPNSAPYLPYLFSEKRASPSLPTQSPAEPVAVPGAQALHRTARVTPDDTIPPPSTTVHEERKCVTHPHFCSFSTFIHVVDEANSFSSAIRSAQKPVYVVPALVETASLLGLRRSTTTPLPPAPLAHLYNLATPPSFSALQTPEEEHQGSHHDFHGDHPQGPAP